MRRDSCVILLTLLIAGCAGRRAKQPARDGEPIGLQMLRAEPSLKGQRFNTLLDFESPRDAVFVAAPGAAVDQARAHTGKSSLHLPAGCDRATVKLASLLSGRSFPGEWALAGAYLWAETPAGVTITYEAEGRVLATRRLKARAGAWTAAMVDVSELARPAVTGVAGVGSLVFTFDGGGAVWVDDVVLVDQSQVLVGGGGGWTIRRRGSRIIGEMPGRFAFKLPSAEASEDGWEVVEANPMRLRCRSEGKTKALTVYSDGRALWDGRWQPFAAEVVIGEGAAASHQSPGEVGVPEEMGRVDRETPGDANHDGYNEILGAYQVVSRGARVDVRLTPQGVPLVCPILEVAGLPAGKVLVTIEGLGVSDSARTVEGHVLVKLPVRIERSAVVNVRVE